MSESPHPTLKLPLHGAGELKTTISIYLYSLNSLTNTASYSHSTTHCNITTDTLPSQPAKMPTEAQCLHAAQMLGITFSFVLSGASAAVSIVAIPRVLDLPTTFLVLKQWNSMYHQGKVIFPIGAATTSAVWFALAGYAYRAGSLASEAAKFRGYLTAGLLTMGIMPCTLIVLVSDAKKRWEEEGSGIQLMGT